MLNTDFYFNFLNSNVKFNIKKIFNLSNSFNFIDNLNILENPFLKVYLKNINTFKNNYIRIKADFENLKKRSDNEIKKTYKYAVENFSENLLIVLDSLESILISKLFNNLDKILEGVRLTLKIFLNVLEKNNISFIIPDINEVFDPYKHLAISTISNTDLKNNVIINVLQKGYYISDRILRPALVVVNKV